MKFEHLIEINDPLNPLIDPLTREQLWRGLVLRADSPKLFVPHLDDCTIDQRESGSFRRSLRYGELVIVDRVLLTPLQQVRYEIEEQGENDNQRDDEQNVNGTSLTPVPDPVNST